MTAQLLPANFDQLVSAAVQVFWATRRGGTGMQGGTRGKVVSGKNLDGFLGVVLAVAEHCGIPSKSVFITGRTNLTLPGFYRPTKNWDVVIVHEQRLLAVLEFKSQVGSFGNNFNNRAEEVLGNATDLHAAHTHEAFHPSNHRAHQGANPTDPRAPFLGYLMLLEDCGGSTRPVSTNSPHYPPFPEFDGASYAERYRLLCEKLMAQGLYSSASLMLTEETSGSEPGLWRSLSDATNVRNMFLQLAGHLLAASQAQ